MAINQRNGQTAAAAKKFLNDMNSQSAKVRLGDLVEGQRGVLKAKYDFAVQGGAVGAVNLTDDNGDDAKLPDNAIVINNFIDVHTTITSASTPTIALGVVAADDLKSATAIASLTGIVQGDTDGTVGNMIKLTAEKTLTMTIAGTTLTAGAFTQFVEYVVGE